MTSIQPRGLPNLNGVGNGQLVNLISGGLFDSPILNGVGNGEVVNRIIDNLGDGPFFTMLGESPFLNDILGGLSNGKGPVWTLINGQGPVRTLIKKTLKEGRIPALSRMAEGVKNWFNGEGLEKLVSHPFVGFFRNLIGEAIGVTIEGEDAVEAIRSLVNNVKVKLRKRFRLVNNFLNKDENRQGVVRELLQDIAIVMKELLSTVSKDIGMSTDELLDILLDKKQQIKALFGVLDDPVKFVQVAVQMLEDITVLNLEGCFDDSRVGDCSEIRKCAELVKIAEECAHTEVTTEVTELFNAESVVFYGTYDEDEPYEGTDGTYDEPDEPYEGTGSLSSSMAVSAVAVAFTSTGFTLMF